MKITFLFDFGREEAIFLDMKTASVDQYEKVARNVIHYIIHQWIGNIVGPAWWNDLWATEALVRYIEDDFLEEVSDFFEFEKTGRCSWMPSNRLYLIGGSRKTLGPKSSVEL